MPEGEIVIRLVGGSDSGKKETALTENSTDKRQEVINFVRNPINAISKSFTDKSEPMGGLKAFAIAKLGNEAIKLTKQATNFAISQTGNWTGDITAQRNAEKIQVGLDVGSDLLNIGASTLMGAMLGPAGAIVGVVSSIANVGVKYGMKAYNYGLGVASDNRSVAFNKLNAGNELSNWSR